MKILWLASWYPSRLDLYNGDFVQRHAQAVSLYQEVDVIHVIKDQRGELTRDVLVEERRNGRLTEYIIYYHHRWQHLPVVGRFFSEIKFRRLYKKQVRAYLKKNGRPHLAHVHVCMKAGVVALWLKRKLKLPYVITEHSTAFLANADTRIADAPYYYRLSCRRILQQAKAITVVSEHLGKAVADFAKGVSYRIIPNVVNTDLFRPAEKTPSTIFRFVHASGLGYQKNPEAILAAFALLKERTLHFVLDIFGPANPQLVRMAKELGLEEVVHFHPEVPQTELAVFIQNADALILFSRFETFGCVVIEANACGVPVVVSDVPPMREIVTDKFNGLIVQNNEQALAEALCFFMQKKIQFDSTLITADAEKKYSCQTVGAAFSTFYKSIVLERNMSS